MTRLAHPFAASPSGRSQVADYGSPDHVQDCLELLILTGPGERVMRPDFGSPVRQMLFAAGNGTVAVALEATLRAAILKWLGHLLSLEALQISFDPAAAVLLIEVTYRVLLTGDLKSLTLSRGLA